MEAARWRSGAEGLDFQCQHALWRYAAPCISRIEGRHCGVSVRRIAK
jgi:hypothetical protein